MDTTNMEVNVSNYPPAVLMIGNGRIKTSYNVFYKEEKGMYSCFVPAYGMAFCAPDESSVTEMADSAVLAFFAHWLDYERWSSFVLQIHKLGFKSPSNATALDDLLKHRPKKVNFKKPALSSYTGFGLDDPRVHSKYYTSEGVVA